MTFSKIYSKNIQGITISEETNLLVEYLFTECVNWEGVDKKDFLFFFSFQEYLIGNENLKYTYSIKNGVVGYAYFIVNDILKYAYFILSYHVN